MTPAQRTFLMTLWSACGAGKCSHRTLEGLRNADGDLTGMYVCTTCGAELVQGQPAWRTARYVDADSPTDPGRRNTHES